MTLGLATVGASAATTKYADKNDIDYQEAADVLSSVGVFEGKGENFAPKDNLNRAEAAKLVAYLMLGNKTAEAIHGNGNRFSDVPADHWAVGYIEYLATAGVVSGVGDGKFNPNGQVTAVQFAKMLCVALGYDAQVEGYVGNSWNINIMKQANDDDIFKTLEVGSNDALTREQAAQMCLNALKANMVEYESKGDTLTINNSTVVLNAKKAKDKTTTATKGNAIKDDDAWGTTTNPYTLQLGEDLYNGDLKMEKTRDDFGRPANKWTYKMEKVGTYANIGDLKATYTDEIKNGPIYDLLGSSVYDHLVLGTAANNYAQLHYFEDGVGYGNTTDGWVNNSATAATNKTAVQYFVLKNGDKAINYNADGNGSTSSGRGSVTQVFVDKDDNVDIVVMNTYVFQAAGDYRSSTEDIVLSIPSDAGKQANAYDTMSLNNYRLELNDFPQIKDYKKDDYLLVTAHKDGNRYKVDSVEKAEKLTGKVDKVVIEDSVTIDGELKKYNKTATDKTKQNEFSVGQEATVVLDKYGYIVYVDEAVVASNYVFISELYQNNGSTSKVQANAYFSDGTNQTITVKEVARITDRSELVKSTKNADMAAGVVGTSTTDFVSNYAGWYTYSKNSADEYTLTAIKSGWAEENEYYNGKYATDKTALTKGDTVKFLSNTALSAAPFASGTGIKAQDAKANSKTIMVVAYKDNTDVDVYTGVKNLPDITLNAASSPKTAGEAAVFSVLDGDGYARYVFVSLEGNYSVYGTESENLLYIVKYDQENSIANNKRYYTYKALDENAKEVLIETDTAFAGTSGVYEAFYKTNKNADGRYTRALSVPTTTGAKYFATNGSVTDKIVADGDTLSVGGKDFTLANNSKIVYVSRVDELNKKDTLNNSGYEADIVSPDGLEAFVKGYTVTYTVQAKLDDTNKGNGGKIIEAYVTITAAVPEGTAASGSTTDSGILKLILPSDLIKGQYVKVYYGGSSEPTGAAVKAALDEALKGTGYSVSKTSYTTTAVGGGAATDFVFDLIDSNGATFPAAIRYNATKGTDTIESVGLSGIAAAADGTTVGTKTLVVPAGKTLVIPDKVNLSVNGDVYVDGALTIQKGGTLTMNGTKTMTITKDGDVTVISGAKFSGTSATVDVQYGSTSLVSAGTFEAKELKAAGDVKFTGGTAKVDKVDLKNGADMEMSSSAVLTSTTGVTVEPGAALSLEDSATIDGTTTVKAGSTVTLTDTATLTDATTESGAKITVNGTEQIASGEKLGDTKTTLTVDVKDGLEITAVSGASMKSAGVYFMSSDTSIVTITVKNNSKSDSVENLSVDVNPSDKYAASPKEKITIAAGESVTIEVKRDSEQTTNVNLGVGIGTKAQAPASTSTPTEPAG